MSTATTPPLTGTTVPAPRPRLPDGSQGNPFGLFLNNPPKPDLPEDDLARLRAQMRECVAGSGGEVSARGHAAALGQAYLALNPQGRRRFLEVLATGFDVDHDAVDRAAAALHQTDGSDAARRAAEHALRASLDAPRVKLLTQFNAIPEGVKFLVDLRAELLPLAHGDPALQGLEDDLKRLLASWFDIGFLALQRITWQSPAALLEKLIGYEAVHAIHGWDDLKNRLDSDRRCFAFFHPCMPDEPLIFVEVALQQGLAGSIQDLLDPQKPLADPAAADTAIFYSISNAQRGLAGIGFGGFLIKRVVDLLAAEFSHLRDYATLSPLPGFRAWLQGQPGGDLLLPAERRVLAEVPVEPDAFAALVERPGWAEDAPLADALRTPLTRLAARYLMQEKRKSTRAADPVAHFHLSNGARVERLNWLADRSPKGMAQSYGLMVNYRYLTPDMAANHEAYVGEGTVAAAPAIRALLS